MVEPFLIANDLNGHKLAGAMIAAFEHLPEGAFAQGAHDFVTIRQVVVVYN